MTEFIEIAERVWVARYAWFDVNVTLVGGEAGLVVVDTHGSTLAGSEVVADVRRLGVGDVTAVEFEAMRLADPIDHLHLQRDDRHRCQ